MIAELRIFTAKVLLTISCIVFLCLAIESNGSSAQELVRDASVRLSFVGDEFVVGPTDFLAGGFPDGQVTFIREEGRVRMWAPVSDRGRTVEFTTDNFRKVRPATSFTDSSLEPNGRGYGPDYLGGSKVIRLGSGELVMLVHGEEQPCPGTPHPAIVRIGLARSDDNGATWNRGPAIISGPPADGFTCESEQFYGAGSLTAVVDSTRTWVYVWFQHWGGAVWGDPFDGIKVARARIADGLGPGTWWKYFEGSWSQPGLGGRATTVIPVPEPIRENDFAGIASVTWNSDFNLFVGVFTTYTGFWWATSKDGVAWSKAEQLLIGKSMITPNLGPEDYWYYYPSLIDPSADEDGRSARQSILYYSKGGPTNSVTNWFGRRVKIEKVELPELPPTGVSLNYWWIALVAVGISVTTIQRVSRFRGPTRVHVAEDLGARHREVRSIG
jgi:hypothetical protein